MKAICLDTFRRLNVNLKELERVPNAEEIVELSKERYEQLSTTNNVFNEVFVKEYKEAVIKEKKIETAIKKKKNER